MKLRKARCSTFCKAMSGVFRKSSDTPSPREYILPLYSHVVFGPHVLHSSISGPYLLINLPRMNWTGGYLKRHSKAKANHLRKSQKQYFAKARQKLQSGSVPPHPSTFLNFNGESTADRHFDLNRMPSVSSKIALHRESSPDGQDTRAQAINPCKDDAMVCSLVTRHKNTPLEVLKAREKTKPLDHIKRRLLRNSDWTGLALARPVSIKFTTAKEMERIGRRRKVTKEERRSKTRPSGRQKVQYHLIRPFDDQRSQSTTPVPEATDLSIRIGSNIHQALTTQTSLQEQPQSSSYHSTTGDSMLLDKFEQQTGDSQNKDRELVYLAPHADSVRDSERPNLMPLDEARVVKSFDEVLQRSTSVLRQMLPSSTPSGDGPPYQRTPTGALERETSPVSSFGSKFHPEDVVPHLAKAKHSLSDARNARNRKAEHVQLRSTQRSEPCPPRSGAAWSEFRRPIAAFHREDQPSTSESQGQARCFTLDLQVALEPESSGRACSSIHGGQPVARTGANLQTSHYSPKSFLQITNSTPLSTNLPLGSPGGGGAPHLTSLPVSFVPSTGSPGPQPSAHRSPRQSGSGIQALTGFIPTSSRSTASPREVQAQPRGAESWMQKFQHAKNQHQASTRNENTYLEKSESRNGRLSDENEAWMKFVFPKDFGNIQTNFRFGTNPLGKKNSKATSVGSSDYERHSRSVSGHHIVRYSSARVDMSSHLSGDSGPSAANATIYDPRWCHEIAADSPLARSETDFLSRFSPMEGVLDEGLGDVSIYNNAPATDRSFASMPHSNTRLNTMNGQHLRMLARRTLPAKRTAIHAFDEPSEPISSNRGLRHKAHLAAFTSPLQQNLVRPGALATSHRTPLQARGQTNSHSKRYGLHSSRTGLTRHRGAMFPMGYSPASLDGRKLSQPPCSTPLMFRPIATSSPSTANNSKSDHYRLADGQSLWQVSPGRSEKIGSSKTGSQIREAALRTSLFGNVGRTWEATRCPNTLPSTRPAISQYF